MSTGAVTKQCDFLESMLPEFEALQTADEAFAFLTHPLGAGGAFKMLCAERTD